MASSWIIARPTKGDGRNRGRPRYRVLYRLEGRESNARYAGSFATKGEAVARKRWVDGELSALRVPDLSVLGTDPVRAPTVRQACDRWRASRVDVTDATRVLHRLALARALSVLGNDQRVDELEPADVIRVVTELAAAGKKRETIRKSVKYLAAVLDDHGVDPNPARDRRVRLPHEEHEEIDPPTADYVETVCRTLTRAYRLPLLWLDWSGARVGSIDSLTIDDYDERDRRVRLRASTTKNTGGAMGRRPGRARGGDRGEPATAGGQERGGALFPGCSADRVRTAIARACRANGIPVFSRHDLRHRRISLLHRQGRSWAEIARFVGQRKLSITADTYTHVLSDGAEIDYQEALT